MHWPVQDWANPAPFTDQPEGAFSTSCKVASGLVMGLAEVRFSTIGSPKVTRVRVTGSPVITSVWDAWKFIIGSSGIGVGRGVGVMSGARAGAMVGVGGRERLSEWGGVYGWVLAWVGVFRW